MKKFVISTMMVSIILSASLFAKDNAMNISNEEWLHAYELGHYHGINQLEREFKQSISNENNKIQFKNFMVIINVSDIPAHQIFLLKNYGLLEGVNPVTLTNNMLVFNSFDRKADALYLTNILNKNYRLEKDNRKVEIYANEDVNKEYEKAPFIYRSLFQTMIDRMKEEVKGKVYVQQPILSVKETAMPTRILSRKPDPEPIKTTSTIVERIEKNEASMNKDSQIKNEVENKRIFTPKYTKVTALTYDAPLEKFDSKNWKESLFKDANLKFNKGEKLASANTIKTDRGVTYIKILDKNLWVDMEDVTLIGGKN